MSDALRNFIYDRDPNAKGLDFVVSVHDLEALLEAHEIETLAPPEECGRWHCSDGDCVSDYE